MFTQLKAKSECCKADIIAIIGIPLLRLACSKCRLIVNRKVNEPIDNSHIISEENYTRLQLIPEDIMDLDDAIDLLIKRYWEFHEPSKAQQILSTEENVH